MLFNRMMLHTGAPITATTCTRTCTRRRSGLVVGKGREAVFHTIPAAGLTTSIGSASISAVSHNTYSSDSRIRPICKVINSPSAHGSATCRDGRVRQHKGDSPCLCSLTEDKEEVSVNLQWSGGGIDLRTNEPTPEAIRTAARKILDSSGLPRQGKRTCAGVCKSRH